MDPKILTVFAGVFGVAGLPAPMCRVVAAPAKLTKVAVLSIRSNDVLFVVKLV
jgi:hypothetical protein